MLVDMSVHAPIYSIKGMQYDISLSHRRLNTCSRSEERFPGTNNSDELAPSLLQI